MTYLADHSVAAPLRAVRTPRRAKVRTACPKCRDARWAAVSAALVALRDGNRRSVRIVDADCGNGTLLLCAVQQARALGFTAIEARGIDAAPAHVARARAAAAAMHDPAIGIAFETGDLLAALDVERELPADIVLWHGARGRNASAEARAVACAGRTLIADPVEPKALAA
ncbi:hypothetical protein [Sphingomonas sp. PAMC 26621]|uniref:hypothetical protein n=1 Tax=Sphingomonas sp. PAMC 26621 TaxID=1112213 RepID=UPI000289FC39|nr:hypothetical protein [Sphingomonas sp. PAMC 26621]